MIVNRPIRANAKALGGLHRVNIGAKEEKLPAVLFLLALNHPFNLFAVIAAACVFHAVRRDHKQRMLRHVLLPRVFVNVSNMMNRAANRIQQGSAAADKIIPVRHRRNLLNRHAVVDHIAHVIKENGRNQRFTRLFLLLFNHGVKAADGIPLQPAHRAAAIQDKHNFRQILLHHPFLHHKIRLPGFPPCSPILLRYSVLRVAWQATSQALTAYAPIRL